MKLKINKSLSRLIIILFLTLSMLSLTIISVADNNYNIELVGTEYEFLETLGSGSQKFNRYKIMISLKNTGMGVSDEIRVDTWGELEDENASLWSSSAIEPGETVEFIFDQILYGTGEHMLFYKYYPTNLTLKNSYNSGEGSFKIDDGSITKENTPGFETILILLAFVFLYLINRKIK